MNLQLVAEYDDALTALETFADFAGRSWVEDPQLENDRGTSAWITRWLHHPITLLRVFDSLYARTTAALSEVTLEIALLREHLATHQGGGAEGEVLARRAADLLCHEADLEARVGRAAQERILAARAPALTILRAAIGRLSFESALRTNGPSEAAGRSEPGRRGETYRRLAEEVRALAGPGDVVDWPTEVEGASRGATGWHSRRAPGTSPAWVAAGTGGLRSADRPAPRRP